MTKYRIVPKRDFSRNGFLINGRWVRHGFVVTDGVCNIMPGATWFQTVAEAMEGLGVWLAAKGDAKAFWKHYHP